MCCLKPPLLVSYHPWFCLCPLDSLIGLLVLLQFYQQVLYVQCIRVYIMYSKFFTRGSRALTRHSHMNDACYYVLGYIRCRGLP